MKLTAMVIRGKAHGVKKPVWTYFNPFKYNKIPTLAEVLRKSKVPVKVCIILAVEGFRECTLSM